MEIYTGDICDEFKVHQACKGMDGVFHLAAFKHVGLAEKFAVECTESNVIGSLNILRSSRNVTVMCYTLQALCYVSGKIY